MSSTGNASGGFFRIMTADSHLWKTFTVTSSMCPHVDPALIAADRENLKDSVFAIKHDARFLYGCWRFNDQPGARPPANR
jgi:hypothetical protein